MSMQQVRKAILDGYGSPFYPMPEIQGLVEAFTRESPLGLSAATLDANARRCTGFAAGNRLLRTVDGYIWRCILEFRVGRMGGNGRIAIAIPCTEDWDREDGVQLDRSPAVYMTGSATRADAQRVVEALAHVLTT